MSALVWGLEWRLALSNKRTLALSVATPLAVVLVIATGAVPMAATSAAYTILFVGIGVVATALAVLRDGARGMTERVVRGGLSPVSYLLQRAGASAALTFIELLPSTALAGVFLHASAPELLTAWATLLVSLWIGCLVGVVVAAMSRSATEATALCGVGLVLLLHMSGVFTTPSPYGYAAILEAASPFRALHESFVTMVTGGGIGGWIAMAVWAIGLPLLVRVQAPVLSASLER